MAAGAKALAVAVGIYRENLRIGLDEPGRRSGGGCAQDDLQTCLSQHIYSSIQPLPLVVTFGRLHFGPGKFANANQIEAGLTHETRVGRPTINGPVLRIVTDAKFQS